MLPLRMRAIVMFCMANQMLSHLAGQTPGTTNQVPKYVSPTSIGNSTITDDNGKVGIGTTTPAAQLDVNGKAVVGTRNGLDPNFLGGTASIVQPGGTATSLAIWEGGVGSGHLGFRPFDSKLYLVNSYRTGLISEGTALVLDTDGNVGIGTASPTERLSLGGNMRLAGPLGTGITFPDGSRQTTAQLKGDKGDKGDQGIQGKQGIPGIQGIQGVPGIPGQITYVSVKTFAVCGGVNIPTYNGPCTNRVGVSASGYAVSESGPITCPIVFGTQQWAYVCRP